MTFEPNPLITKGIISVVYSYDHEGNPKGRYGRYGIGHVSLLDWDDHVSIGDARQIAENSIGPTFIFESSPGNLHGWNLAIRRFHRTKEYLISANDDTKHTDIGVERGWWRLRAGPKLTSEDNTYKDSPKPIDVIYGDLAKVSSPHLRIAEALYGERTKCSEMYGLEGNCTEAVMYTTFTDREKLIQRNG